MAEQKVLKRLREIMEITASNWEEVTKKKKKEKKKKGPEPVYSTMDTWDELDLSDDEELKATFDAAAAASAKSSAAHATATMAETTGASSEGENEEEDNDEVEDNL